MKRALILSTIALVVAASGAMAQSEPLLLDHDNVGASGQAPTGTATLWDQTDSCGGNGPASQLFPDFGNNVIQSADDFVVPAGTSWTLERVFNQGTFFNPNPGNGPIDSVIVEVYDDTGAGGLPGVLVCSETGLIPAGGPVDPNLDVTLDGTCVLAEGTYWLSMMVNMPFVPAGQYAWVPNASANGSEFAFQDPSGLTGNPCVTWGLGITTCGVGASSPDLCFGIDGTEGGVPTMPLGGYVALLGLMALIGLVVLRRAF